MLFSLELDCYVARCKRQCSNFLNFKGHSRFFASALKIGSDLRIHFLTFLIFTFIIILMLKEILSLYIYFIKIKKIYRVKLIHV